MEHSLYDKPSCTTEEKIKLSDDFEIEYESKEEEFYKIIEMSKKDVPTNYEESWEYIFDGTNSLRRGTNYLYLLDEIKNKKNK